MFLLCTFAGYCLRISLFIQQEFWWFGCHIRYRQVDRDVQTPNEECEENTKIMKTSKTSENSCDFDSWLVEWCYCWRECPPSQYVSCQTNFLNQNERRKNNIQHWRRDDKSKTCFFYFRPKRQYNNRDRTTKVRPNAKHKYKRNSYFRLQMVKWW